MAYAENPIIIHIVSILREATEEDLRLLYQVVRAIVKPLTK